MSTPKQLAEKIGIEYHQGHPVEWQIVGFEDGYATRSWDAFLACTHEICEDSRELMAYLDTQSTAKWVRKDWEEEAAKQEVSA